MTVKSVRFVGLLLVTLTIFVVVDVETSASNEVYANNQTYLRPEVLDVKARGRKLRNKRLAAPVDGTDPEEELGTKTRPTSEKHEIPVTRVVLKRVKPTFPRVDRVRGSIVDEGGDRVEQQTNQHEGRVKRNVTTLDEANSAKKNHKKLKLARSQVVYKNWKRKGHSGDLNDDKRVDDEKKKVSRRGAIYFTENEDGTGRSKRYAVTRSFKDDKSDYYAQRKAVMDRFYARQKEIAEKYAKKMSTTPRYIYRYDSNPETDRNNVSSDVKMETVDVNKTRREINDSVSDLSTNGAILFTMQAEDQVVETTTVSSRDSRSDQIQTADNSTEENIEEDTSDDYDYYTLEDSKFKPALDVISDNNGALNDAEWVTDDSRSDTLKWGACSGKLVYQHNLIIGVRKAAMADADLSTSLEGPFCITCIRAVPVNKIKSTVSFDVGRREDGSFSLVKLKVTGFQDEELSYIVKIWAVNKKNDRCDHV